MPLNFKQILIEYATFLIQYCCIQNTKPKTTTTRATTRNTHTIYLRWNQLRSENIDCKSKNKVDFKSHNTGFYRYSIAIHFVCVVAIFVDLEQYVNTMYVIVIIIITIIQRKKYKNKIMCRKLGENGVEHFFNKTLKNKVRLCNSNTYDIICFNGILIMENKYRLS